MVVFENQRFPLSNAFGFETLKCLFTCCLPCILIRHDNGISAREEFLENFSGSGRSTSSKFKGFGVTCPPEGLCDHIYMIHNILYKFYPKIKIVFSIHFHIFVFSIL